MTCIVAVEHDGKVYMGGDSAGTNSWHQQSIRREPKVFRRGRVVIGYTTSFRMGQLLQHTLVVPQWSRDFENDVHGWMVRKFIPAVRKCLHDGHWLETKNEQDTGGCFLVGYRGLIFSIGSDMQVGSPADGYDAVGCGDDLALGSLHTTKAYEISPRIRIEVALDAAAHHSAGVAGPYTYVETP